MTNYSVRQKFTEASIIFVPIPKRVLTDFMSLETMVSPLCH